MSYNSKIQLSTPDLLEKKPKCIPVKSFANEGLLKGIYNGKDYSGLIDAYRDYGEKKVLPGIPLASFSVTFSQEPSYVENIERFHNRMAFSFDVNINPHIYDMGDFENLKDRLRDDPYVLLAYKCLGEAGLVVVLNISCEMEYFPFAVKDIKTYFRKKYDLIERSKTAAILLDRHYISLDANPVFNPKAKPFSPKIPADALLQNELKIQNILLSEPMRYRA